MGGTQIHGLNNASRLAVLDINMDPKALVLDGAILDGNAFPVYRSFANFAHKFLPMSREADKIYLYLTPDDNFNNYELAFMVPTKVHKKLEDLWDEKRRQLEVEKAEPEDQGYVDRLAREIEAGSEERSEDGKALTKAERNAAKKKRQRARTAAEKLKKGAENIVENTAPSVAVTAPAVKAVRMEQTSGTAAAGTSAIPANEASSKDDAAVVKDASGVAGTGTSLIPAKELSSKNDAPEVEDDSREGKRLSLLDLYNVIMELKDDVKKVKDDVKKVKENVDDFKDEYRKDKIALDQSLANHSKAINELKDDINELKVEVACLSILLLSGGGRMGEALSTGSSLPSSWA
ncbi:hypothetical protein HDU96_009120 [Phlyctochytrium bullatum]|nr:hypothetical protein HDU96_009120 [Phlyctochytrium bullatum]